jgi:hypothetical protein
VICRRVRSAYVRVRSRSVLSRGSSRTLGPCLSAGRTILRASRAILAYLIAPAHHCPHQSKASAMSAGGGGGV